VVTMELTLSDPWEVVLAVVHSVVIPIVSVKDTVDIDGESVAGTEWGVADTSEEPVEPRSVECPVPRAATSLPLIVTVKEPWGGRISPGHASAPNRVR
jgi:hypothetical protein